MDKGYFKDYYHLERNHWWFRARLEILEAMLRKRILDGNSEPLRILNAGVATGATSTMLEKFGTVDSLEYDEDCCLFLREDLKMTVTHGSLTDLPYSNQSYDLVCAFDVIEHIEDDTAALKEIRRVLKPEGYYFITVPAFQFLWSDHDVINHHFRRYTLKGLLAAIERAALPVSWYSYFNFWLFPPIAIIRLMQDVFRSRRKVKVVQSDFERVKGNSMIARILYRIFRNESGLLVKGSSYPWGISLMAYGQIRRV